MRSILRLFAGKKVTAESALASVTSVGTREVERIEIQAGETGSLELLCLAADGSVALGPSPVSWNRAIEPVRGEMPTGIYSMVPEEGAELLATALAGAALGQPAWRIGVHDGGCQATIGAGDLARLAATCREKGGKLALIVTKAQTV